MVVVLGVVGVAALLRVGPSTHLLEAAGWVATLDQAYRLQKYKDQGEGFTTQTVNPHKGTAHAEEKGKRLLTTFENHATR